MATDRAYAEEFIRNSVAKGHVFTVTLEGVDPFQTQALFLAAHSLTKTPNAPQLVAGCKVLTVYSGDETARLRQKLQACAHIISSP